jgi:hypothetical protein
VTVRDCVVLEHVGRERGDECLAAGTGRRLEAVTSSSDVDKLNFGCSVRSWDTRAQQFG